MLLICYCDSVEAATRNDHSSMHKLGPTIFEMDCSESVKNTEGRGLQQTVSLAEDMPICGQYASKASIRFEIKGMLAEVVSQYGVTR